MERECPGPSSLCGYGLGNGWCPRGREQWPPQTTPFPASILLISSAWAILLAVWGWGNDACLFSDFKLVRSLALCWSHLEASWWSISTLAGSGCWSCLSWGTGSGWGWAGDVELNRAATVGSYEAILRWLCTLVSPLVAETVAHVLHFVFRPCLLQQPWQGGEPGGGFHPALEGWGRSACSLTFLSPQQMALLHTLLGNERAHSCHSLRVDSELCLPPSAWVSALHPILKPPSRADFLTSTWCSTRSCVAPAAEARTREMQNGSVFLYISGRSHPSLWRAQGRVSSSGWILPCLTKQPLGRSWVYN